MTAVGRDIDARPNILLVMADQHPAHLLSAVGASHLSTPSLDALSASGTHFTRAYTTFPLCVPARASMITGRMPHQLGLSGNTGGGVEPARDPRSMGHALRTLGYDTAYAGKWHALQPSAELADGFDIVAPFGDRGLADAAADWLRDRAGSDRPFAFVVSFDDPHSICEYARNQPMPYGDVGPMPPVRDLPPLPTNHAPAEYEPQVLRQEQDRAATAYGASQFGPDDWRRYRYTLARLVERADAHVGTVLDALAEAGLAQDTVVIYTSDHGDGDASHRWNQKTALFEETSRVPLIVRDPRRDTQPATCAELVSVGLDLLPTMLAVAGVLPATDGIDLVEVGSGARGHASVVVETCFDRPAGAGTVGRALITPRHKYVVYGWGAHREQLFDLTHDPGEQRNLAMESAHDELLEEHRARLLDWCRRTGDTGFLKRLVLPATVTPAEHDEIFATPY